MSNRSATVAPKVRANSMQSAMLVPARGTNGTTSTAPMRGCWPDCCSMSISATATAKARSSASRIGAVSPASVRTLRLWLGSLVRSRRKAPGTRSTASASLSTTPIRRPSLKFGTDSTSFATLPPFAPAADPCGMDGRIVAQDGRDRSPHTDKRNRAPPGGEARPCYRSRPKSAEARFARVTATSRAEPGAPAERPERPEPGTRAEPSEAAEEDSRAGSTGHRDLAWEHPDTGPARAHCPTG